MLEADADPAGQAVEGEEEELEMESQDLKAEVMRLTLELQEATEEKLQAARYGLVVLEESAALKMKHRQLEEEHEALKEELQGLKEVGAEILLTIKVQKHSPLTLTEEPLKQDILPKVKCPVRTALMAESHRVCLGGTL